MSPRVWFMNSQVFPLGEISINSALSSRACSIFSGGPVSPLEAEELAAGQDHAFGDEAVARCCWERGGQGGWLGACVGGCSAGPGVRGSVFVKASLGGGTEGLGEVRAVVPGLDEEQF